MADTLEDVMQTVACGYGVQLPPGLSDVTVHTFAFASEGHEQSPPTIAVTRWPKTSLEAALARSGDVAARTLLLDEYRVQDGVRFYERMTRFSDPATEQATQEAVRLFEGKTAMLVVQLNASTRRFAQCYSGFEHLAFALGQQHLRLDGAA